MKPYLKKVISHFVRFITSNMSYENRISFTIVLEVLYEKRYCNQEGFSILDCEGKHRNKNYWNQVLEVKVLSLKVTEFPFIEKRHYKTELASFDSKIFGIFDMLYMTS